MSGHSKWATTKHHKALVDAKKANVFGKLSKNIMIAARAGADPEMNFSLRLAVDKAKEASMPREKIDHAIAKGSGAGGGVIVEPVLYEGFGPSGIPVLIDGATDNRNRTTGDVKAILSKNGGTLGAQNSVKWMFEYKGVIHLIEEQVRGLKKAKEDNQDDVILELIDIGCDDVVEEDGGLTLYCKFENFEKIKKELEKKGLKLEYAEMEWVAKNKQAVEDVVREQIDALIEELEDHDDVNNVYSNLL
ncbi:MAG: YebC/PmpR family DNA-binding transcriptional regulator [Parcubacteria group bacterium]